MPDPITLLPALLASVAVYLALVLLAHFLRRLRGMRFNWLYHFFAASTALMAGVSRLSPELEWRAPVLTHLTAVAVVLASVPLSTLLNRICWIRFDVNGRRVEAPRVLIDVTAVLLVTLAVLATLQFIYHIQVPGLLAGSGVAALVLGFGMQEQLKNLFAGLALHFEKPFRTGDWLKLGDTHAKVIEISWRSVRLVTSDDVQIEMDNSAILANPIYNFEQPTQEHAERMTIGLHYDIPPEQAMEVLRTATASVSGVIADQTPKVYLKDFADSAVIYEVKFWLRDHSKRQSILSAVRSHCWYALRRAGMEIPYPQRVLIHPKPVDTTSATRRQAADMLQTHKIFGCLNQAQCAAIVETCPVVLFAPGENLVTQGAPGESMFVLVRGTVDVRIETNGRPTSVAKLGAGDIVGEMSLLTGDARSATVVTEREVEAVQIGKEAFGAFIRSNPAVVDQLSDLLATRQLANTQHAASAGGTTHEQTQRGILHRIRSFFALN